MSCLEKHLNALAPRITAELQPRLAGPFGGFLRAYLPQVWVFDAGGEPVTVRIEANGAVLVLPGPAPNADVRVHGPHDRLSALLSATRAPTHPPPGVEVIAQTARGRAAVSQVRSRFGL